MADKVQLDIEVDGVESSIGSLKDLKNAIKEARNEQVKAQEQFGIGSKQYELASKRVSDLRDKVDDLSDSTKSLQGTGIERASAGFNQLGDGLRNLDLDKVKVGLTAIKSALAATGIMLVVQGVSYLIENFDELSKSGGILGTVLTKVGEVAGSVKDFFTDLVGITTEESRAVEALAEEIKKFAETTKEALSNQTSEYDRLISVAQAEGKSTIDLEIAKQKQIAFSNLLIAKRYETIARQRQLTDEELKTVNEAINNYKNALAATEVAIVTHDKKVTADRQKELDKRKEAEAQHLKEIKDMWLDYQNNKVSDEATYNQIQRDANKMLLNDMKADADNARFLERQAEDEKAVQDEIERAKKEAKEKEAMDKRIAEHQRYVDTTYSLSKQSNDALMSLTDFYFNWKASREEKGSKAEYDLKKKQFNVNKALQATMTVVDTVRGGIKAISENPPPNPIGIISAALIGVAGTIATAKILTQKFPEYSGGSGGGGGNASVPIPSPPTINTPNANVAGTNFDENGKNISNISSPTINVNSNVTATVGVDEIQRKTNRVDTLEKQASF